MPGQDSSSDPTTAARRVVAYAVALVGLAAALYGVHQVYGPAAWIVGGLVVVVAAAVESRP